MKQQAKLSLYEKKILSVFAESYPESAHFSGGRKLRKANWSKIFPEIKQSVDKKNSFLSAVENLEKRGVLLVKWERYRKGDRVVALYLELPDILYSLLDIDDPETVRLEMLELLYGFKTENSIVKKVIGYLIDSFENKKKLFFDDTANLNEFLTLISQSPESISHMTIRALSIKLFNASKRLENILPLFDKITDAACGIKISRYLGLERVFPETTFSGSFELVFTCGHRWTLKNKILTFPEKTVKEIKRIEFESDKERVLSIENKETFYAMSSFSNDFGVYIYCSGHLNGADRLLYELVASSGAEIYHFGDLDPDGLLIFNEIDEAVEGKLQPWLMNEEIFLQYQDYGYKLSSEALKRIDNFENRKLQSLTEVIKETGKGIEQEIIEATQ